MTKSTNQPARTRKNMWDSSSQSQVSKKLKLQKIPKTIKGDPLPLERTLPGWLSYISKKFSKKQDWPAPVALRIAENWTYHREINRATSSGPPDRRKLFSPTAKNSKFEKLLFNIVN